MYKRDALKNITEEQKEELALFAKNLLDSTGVVSTLSELSQCVSESIGDEGRAYLLSLFLEAYIKIIERTCETGKSIKELMGIEFDSYFYGSDGNQNNK